MRKFEQSQAQYNLYKQTAKMSPLLSKNVSKYELLKDVLPRKTCYKKLLQ